MPFLSVIFAAAIQIFIRQLKGVTELEKCMATTSSSRIVFDYSERGNIAQKQTRKQISTTKFVNVIFLIIQIIQYA